MEWIGGLLGGILSQALSAYFWSKTASLALLSIIGLGVAAVLLGLIWLTSKQPKAGLILSGVILASALGVGIVGTKRVAPCPACPSPFKGHTEVSSKWLPKQGTWNRYWMDRHIPKEWKPYQALVRVRVGEKDLYMVFGAGRVLVLGEDLNVKAVEPLTGQ